MLWNEFFFESLYDNSKKYYYDKIDVVNFIMHETFTTNFTVQKRNLVFHATGLPIAPHNSFV
jgi:hypothetical protein